MVKMPHIFECKIVKKCLPIIFYICFGSDNILTHRSKAALLLWIICVMFCYVIFPYGILGQVWYLIVSIPDLYHLSY